jgi:hypothetical protein
MSASNELRPRPTQLPQKIEEWERKIKSMPSLNDHVEDLHRMLWDDSAEYRAYLEAVWDSDAVEGALAIDNVFAAEMIRDQAREIPGNIVGNKKLDTIVKSLGVILRRYENSRKERRHTVHGQRVPTEANNGNAAE